MMRDPVLLLPHRALYTCIRLMSDEQKVNKSLNVVSNLTLPATDLSLVRLASGADLSLCIVV
jgi:hypothetical protein